MKKIQYRLFKFVRQEQLNTYVALPQTLLYKTVEEDSIFVTHTQGEGEPLRGKEF